MNVPSCRFSSCVIVLVFALLVSACDSSEPQTKPLQPVTVTMVADSPGTFGAYWVAPRGLSVEELRNADDSQIGSSALIVGNDPFTVTLDPDSAAVVVVATFSDIRAQMQLRDLEGGTIAEATARNIHGEDGTANFLVGEVAEGKTIESRFEQYRWRQ